MKITHLLLMGALGVGAAVDASADYYPRGPRSDHRRFQNRRAVAQVDDMIARAYRDILQREPDASGLASFRHEILYNGLTEDGMRRAMLNSWEYRTRFGDMRGRRGYRRF